MAKKKQKDVISSIRKKVSAFPTGPGLYFMKDAKDVVLYIGKANNLRSRAGSYFQPSVDLFASRGPKIVEMIKKTVTVDYLETKSQVDAVLQEARLIKDIRPPYNTSLIDSKTFPYLEITTRDQFPGVYITRNPKSARSKLFGPFTSVGDLRGVLVLLQKIFKFRTCKLDIRQENEKRRFFRPCILYSIKQCTAPCGARIEKDDYRKVINDFVRFLQSKRATVLRGLNKQMEESAASMEYEKAAMFRDRIRLIERLDQRGSLEANVQPEVFATDPSDALEKLRKIFDIETPIRIIEGFDIAHISGAETVGSLVRFIDGRPFRSGYRRFRIKTVTGIDDYACMKEVVTRRYKHAHHGEELFPDLVLIDGGKGQLHAVEEAFLRMDVSVPLLASIAKREEEIFIRGRKESIKLPANNEARKLLQYIRDEAHRFAQHYHHILRKKAMLNE